MASVSLVFKLSEKGRKTALLAGLPAKQEQVIHVPPEHPRFADAVELATVSHDGAALVAMEQYCSPNDWAIEKVIVNPPEFDRLPTIDELLDSVIRHRAACEEGKVEWERRREEAARQKYDKRKAELLSQGAMGFISTSYDWGHRRYYLDDHGLGGDPDCQPLLEQAEKLVEEKQAEADADEAKQKALKETEKEADAKVQAERDSWIAAHGSEHLRRLVAEGIECDQIYRKERLTQEHPRWRYCRNVRGEYTRPENPPKDALKLLDEARRDLPEARLVYWTIEHEEPFYCDTQYAWEGYAAVAGYLDEDVVFGNPGKK